MAMRVVELLVCILFISFVDSSELVQSRCPLMSSDFLDSIRAQCPLWIDLTPPFEVHIESLERELAQTNTKTHYSILLYASWCPFSRNFKPIFETLSYMFPQITHLSIEESSAMPNLFSRYGIHGFPALMLANGDSKVRFSGHKNLNSIVKFYKENTGFNPVAYFEVKPSNTVYKNTPILLQDTTLIDKLSKEPFLLLSILFILLKLAFQTLPIIISRFRVLWPQYAWNLKHWVNHILERAAHVVDLKRIWNKVKLFNKGKHLKRGASNARVWASKCTSIRNVS